MRRIRGHGPVPTGATGTDRRVRRGTVWGGGHPRALRYSRRRAPDLRRDPAGPGPVPGRATPAPVAVPAHGGGGRRPRRGVGPRAGPVASVAVRRRPRLGGG